MASTNETKKKKVISNYIPDDIAFSILSNLSVKSVHRFTCVHKSWSTLLENPNFMEIFRKNLLTKSHSLNDDDYDYLLFDWDKTSDPEILSLLSGDFETDVTLDLPPQIKDREFGDILSILGSAVNGIICIVGSCIHRDVVLWNPAIEEVNVLPDGLSEFPPDFSHQSTLHGFGYDHVRDDYKVLRHVDYVYEYHGRIEMKDETKMPPDPFWEIYSLRSNSWRKLDFDMPICNNGYASEVYLDGMCHWWGKTYNETYVVSFDLSNEVFFTTPFDKHGDFHFYLVVLNESIAMISNYNKTKSFDISILGEVGMKESWTRLFRFDIGFLSWVDYPIAVGQKGKLFFNNKGSTLLSCFDLTTGMIEEICVKGERSISQVVMYKKNLRPMGVINN